MNKNTFSCRIMDRGPRHARLAVWNKGGYAGELAVDSADVDELIERINTGVYAAGGTDKLSADKDTTSDSETQ